MSQFKRLASASALPCASASEYFNRLELNTHCFAVCVLFVLDKIITHYSEIEEIQRQHSQLDINNPAELPDTYQHTFQVTEKKSKHFPIGIYKEGIAKSAGLPHAVIVLKSASARHCIAFRQTPTEWYFLDTAGQRGAPMYSTSTALLPDTLIRYIDPIITTKAAQQDPLTDIQILFYSPSKPS